MRYTVIRGECLAKKAGMVLSEFILLDIGGKEFLEDNALRTDESLNIIQPDFIRVHATGFKLESKVWQLIQNGIIIL